MEASLKEAARALGPLRAAYRSSWRKVVFLYFLGILFLLSGAGCSLYFECIGLGLSVLFLPLGGLMLWVATSNQKVRLLVFARGMVFVEGERVNVWRWEDIREVVCTTAPVQRIPGLAPFRGAGNSLWLTFRDGRDVVFSDSYLRPADVIELGRVLRWETENLSCPPKWTYGR